MGIFCVKVSYQKYFAEAIKVFITCIKWNRCIKTGRCHDTEKLSYHSLPRFPLPHALESSGPRTWKTAKLLRGPCSLVWFSPLPPPPPPTPLRLTYWGRSHIQDGISLLYLHFSPSLSQFPAIFVSFLATSSVLYRCSKAMTLASLVSYDCLQCRLYRMYFKCY